MLQSTPPLTAALALLLAATLAGCNHAVVPRTTTVRLSRPATYAISVSLAGGLQPSATQWAAVQSTFARLLAREGITLVSDLGLADRILRIELTPDPEDPENRGQATLLSVRANPQYGTTSPASPWLTDDLAFPSAFGWGWNGFPLFRGYGAYFGYAGYYGYGNAYYDGYSYSAPTLNPRRPHHAHHDQRCDPRKADSPEKPLHRHHPEPPPDGKRPPLLADNAPTSAPAGLVVYPNPQRGAPVFQDDIRLTRAQRGVASSGEARWDQGRNRTERTGTEGESSRTWLRRTLAAADAGVAATTGSGSRSGERSGERSWSRQEGSAGRSETQHRGESSPRSSGSSGSSYSSSSGSASSNSSSSPSYSSSSSSNASSGASSSSSSSYTSSSSSSGSSGSSSGSSSSSGSTGSNRVER